MGGTKQLVFPDSEVTNVVPPPSAMSRFGKSFVQATGIPTHTGTWKENIEELKHFPKTVKDQMVALWRQHLADVATAEARMKTPGAMNKVVGVEEYLESGIPMLGSNLIRGQEQLEKGNYAGAAGTSLGTVTPFLTGEALRLPDTIRDFADTSKTIGKDVIRAKAAPHIEAAGDQVRSLLKTSLDNAEDRVAPLYKNIHAADAEDLAQSGAPGSVNIKPAQDSLEAARKSLYGDVTPKQIGKESEKLGAYTAGKDISLSDMRTARQLRSDLSDELYSAAKRGDRKLAAALRSARQELSNQMKTRASNLGLGTDFERADAQWREIQGIREKLSPLIDEEDSGKLFQKLQEPSPEEANAMSKLQRYGLLDKPKIDRMTKLVGRVSTALRGGYAPWIQRAMFGYVPAAAGIGALKEAGMLPGAFRSYLLPYAGGMGGYTLADVLIKRLRALSAIKNLPDLPEGTSLEQAVPSEPSFPERPTPAPAAIPEKPSYSPTAATLRERERMSAESKVPLELRPRPGEDPLLQSLIALRQETQMDPEQEKLATQLEQELRKHGEKLRTKYRTAEALRQALASKK